MAGADLHNLVRVGTHLDEFRAYIQANPDQITGEKELWANTVLHDLARYNRVDMAIILFEVASELGIKINLECQDWCAETPMHEAAHLGRLKMVRFLHSKGAKLDSVNRFDQTPFVFAAHHGRTKIMDQLLEWNAPGLERLTNPSEPVFPYSCLDFGMSPNQNPFWDVLHREREEAFISLMQWMRRRSPQVKIMDIPDEMGRSPLHIAARNEMKLAVNFLIENGTPHINSLTRENQTPLHLATRTDQVDIIYRLLQAGARDFDRKEEEGHPAIGGILYAIDERPRKKKREIATIFRSLEGQIQSRSNEDVMNELTSWGIAGNTLSNKEMACFTESIDDDTALAVRHRVYFEQSLTWMLLLELVRANPTII